MDEIDIGQQCLKCNVKCPGFAPHSWRNICLKCSCERNCHDIKLKNFVNMKSRLDLSTNESKHVTKLNAPVLGFSWVPEGLSRTQIDDYMRELSLEMIPRLGSEGEKQRLRNIIMQTPKQDFQPQFCHQLKASGQEKTFEEFNLMRKAAAMNIANVFKVEQNDATCKDCTKVVNCGTLAVATESPKDTPAINLWHPGCFKCSVCRQLLVDLLYCEKSGVVYCPRHFGELFCPRCKGCDELIFSGEYTKAMEGEWHNGHFACFRCDVNLSGHRYIVRDEHAYCVRCFEQLFSNMCYECSSTIGSDSKDLSYKDMHWHEKCFKCSECANSLCDQPFAYNQQKLYCADCNDNKFSARCVKCDKIFKSGMKKFDYKGKQWHADCFLCSECQQPIGTMSFVPRANDFVCIRCYNDKFAQKCEKCAEVILKSGVSYRDQPYHRECFTCTTCSILLADEKFATNENQPYCSRCYDDKFAKKCCKCDGAISGMGGNTKYVTFEDKSWHSACFLCTTCDCTLVGQGFIVDGEKILCAECATAN